MRFFGFIWLAIIALALVPQGAALAADTISGDRYTNATLSLDRELQVGSYIDSAIDRDWWRVSLSSGKAYILRGTSDVCGVTVSIYNSIGARLKTVACYGAYQAGLEFIPPYTGIYYVEFAANGRSAFYPYHYYADALNDCAGSRTTTCAQALNLDFSTRLQTRGDSDWRTINLRAGQIYTAAATNGNTFFLSVRKPDGAILAYRSGYSPRIVFAAPTTGRYFVEVKSTQDTYSGSNLVFYIVGNGNLSTSALTAGGKDQVSARAGDNAPRTLEEAKASAGKENTD